MSRIKIKNFGPIKEGYIEDDGWISIDKVTVFIGNQGSGKSTVAKLISTFSWIEKAIFRGDLDGALSRNEIEEQLKYHRINHYLKNNTQIEYEGDILKIKYTKNTIPHFENVDNTVVLVPQIIYIPAERSILSIVPNLNSIKGLPDALQDFAIEFKNAQIKYANHPFILPIGNVKYEYNSNNDLSIIKGNDFRIGLHEAASGFQSYIPMYLVVSNLIVQLHEGSKTLDVSQFLRSVEEKNNIIKDSSLSNEEKRIKILEIDNKYTNSFLINIVEEPELNLFPTSQWEMLKSLLEANNSIDKNKLIITTHSPYIVNYLSLAVQAASLKDVISDDGLRDRLNSIVPLTSTVNASDLVIYEMNEITGTITKLGNYEGIPADQNYLNQSLVEGNRLFDALLEIEQEL